jgi:hypothetical protein
LRGGTAPVRLECTDPVRRWCWTSPDQARQFNRKQVCELALPVFDPFGGDEAVAKIVGS